MYVYRYSYNKLLLTSEQSQELKLLGLSDIPNKKKKFIQIMKALKMHNDLYGDYLVPRYFVVPHEPPWPEELWGMQLGTRVNNIRHKRAYYTPYYLEKLNRINFFLPLWCSGVQRY